MKRMLSMLMILALLLGSVGAFAQDGVLSDAFTPMGKETHRMLLEMEKVPFLANGNVDLQSCFWEGPERAR